MANMAIFCVGKSQPARFSTKAWLGSKRPFWWLKHVRGIWQPQPGNKDGVYDLFGEEGPGKVGDGVSLDRGRFVAKKQGLFNGWLEMVGI